MQAFRRAVGREQMSSLPLQFFLLTVAGWMTRPASCDRVPAGGEQSAAPAASWTAHPLHGRSASAARAGRDQARPQGTVADGDAGDARQAAALGPTARG